VLVGVVLARAQAEQGDNISTNWDENIFCWRVACLWAQAALLNDCAGERGAGAGVS